MLRKSTSQWLLTLSGLCPHTLARPRGSDPHWFICTPCLHPLFPHPSLLASWTPWGQQFSILLSEGFLYLLCSVWNPLPQIANRPTPHFPTVSTQMGPTGEEPWLTDVKGNPHNY